MLAGVVSVLRQTACFSQSDTVARINTRTNFIYGIPLTALTISDAHLFATSILQANAKIASHSAELV